jgi:hypothetical protein
LGRVPYIHKNVQKIIGNANVPHCTSRSITYYPKNKKCLQGLENDQGSWSLQVTHGQKVISTVCLTFFFLRCVLLLIVCSTAATQSWIYNIGIDPKPGKLWNAWHVNNQTAGYITEFDLGDTESSFIFVTVHGAGHEVPAYRPLEAFSLFKSYFSGKWD